MTNEVAEALVPKLTLIDKTSPPLPLKVLLCYVMSPKHYYDIVALGRSNLTLPYTPKASPNRRVFITPSAAKIQSPWVHNAPHEAID